jgi:hypothetical protein
MSPLSISGAATALAVAACLILPERAWADDERAPQPFIVSAVGSLVAENQYDPEAMANMLSVGEAAGVVVDLRWVGANTAVYGDVEALPVGSIYSARIGFITGAHMSNPYTEFISQVTNGTTTTTTYAVYNFNVRGVWGLDVSASLRDLGGAAALNLEAGIGGLGQHQYDCQLVYDIVHGIPGLRVRAVIALVEGESVAFSTEVGIETLFDLSHTPVAGLVTLGFGFGPAF